ncbi:hypothetical protein BGZ94_000397 [Podila epigama]|nr:hypothetical protein BGZ94_000397 [Podila epigama]
MRTKTTSRAVPSPSQYAQIGGTERDLDAAFDDDKGSIISYLVRIPNVIERPHVLIAGAGLGGLSLAIMLSKADITFEILERSAEVRPLGAALVLGNNIGPLFEQLGIYEEFKKLAKQATDMSVFSEELKLEYIMRIGWLERMVQYKEYFISRPDLYDLLWRQIPEENIHMNKKILSFDQDNMGVHVRCEDGTTYKGDILVGADGAYSAVRQHLYKILKAEGKLPASDQAPLSFKSVCLVGKTLPLDPSEFPSVQSKVSHVNSVLGSTNRCSWTTITTKNNTVCWAVIKYLSSETSRADRSFRNTEWGPQAAEAMCREVYSYKIPNGKFGRVSNLGEYIDRTPKHLISKVMLEEKVFDTWYNGRVVLIGDACHKMNPSGGSGAANAIHDAVALANWLSTLQSSSVYELKKVFKEYQSERLPVVKKAFETSHMLSKNLEKGKSAALYRKMIKRLPMWMWQRIILKMMSQRPQVSFLPPVEEKGLAKTSAQPSLHKTRAILEQQELEKDKIYPISRAVL